MKYIILSSLFISSLSWAVVVKHCPKSLNLKVDPVESFSKGFAYSVIEDFGIKMKVDSVSLDYFVERKKREFDFEFKLSSTEGSVCSYEFISSNPYLKIDLKITGTDKDPKLVLNYTDEVHHGGRDQTVEYRMFADPSSKRPVYNFSGSKLQVKSYATYRNWGVTEIFYVPVGKGIISSPSYGVEGEKEKWSINLLKETYPSELEDAVKLAISDLNSNETIVAVLPEVINYKYFNVKFQKINNGIASPLKTSNGLEIVYEFD